jgi:putative PIN family toxin of toxin-antitoxin system
MKSEKKNVVLDTNIIISAAITKEGLPSRILELLVEGKIINFTTGDIVKELLRVFDKPSVRNIVKDEDKRLVLAGYISKSIIIFPEFNEKAVLDDPSDDKFINCALTSKPNIVSGDTHLLKLKEYKGVKIMSAKEFLKK